MAGRQPTGESEATGAAAGRRWDVIVVGGGQAGLAVAWHLARLGLRFVVLDASDSVGQSWRTRWDSLTLFTPAQYDALPGMAFPAPTDTYPGKDAVADYLRAYATGFELPVRLDARVTDLRSADGDFEVRTGDDVWRADQVVVATGPFQVPFLPSVDGSFDSTVTQMHSSEYRNPHVLPRGPALVVGGGNSGMQIAAELVATRDVVMAIGGRPTVLPQRLAGRDLFWWLTRLGVMRVSTATRLGRRLRGRGEFVIGAGRRRLRRAGVRFRPRLVGADGRTARFADGTGVDVDVVVWATGYRTDYSWISIPGVVRDGRLVNRRGVTDVPGLYSLGLPWQHTRGSALLGFVADDAGHIAGHIAGRIADRIADRIAARAAGTSTVTGAVNVRILVAHDASAYRETLVAVLDLEDDLEVVAEIASGDGVEPAALEHRPDVALLDLDLPGIDGLTAAARLRERLPACRVLILTGPGARGEVPSALAAGVSGFLVKDSAADDLVGAVRTVARGERVLPTRPL